MAASACSESETDWTRMLPVCSHSRMAEGRDCAERAAVSSAAGAEAPAVRRMGSCTEAMAEATSSRAAREATA